MGRYRPPSKPSSKYITPAGKRRLVEELDFLWLKKRPEVTNALSAAAAEGDRSENAEYIYRKKQLREIDTRVRHLRKRLDNMVVVDNVPSDSSRIFFGAYVHLENEEGEEVLYRIVGPDEFDKEPHGISMDSPLAKALMGKRVDDEIDVSTPKGNKTYFILKIRYS